jgi:hypothetical protein
LNLLFLGYLVPRCEISCCDFRQVVEHRKTERFGHIEVLGKKVNGQEGNAPTVCSYALWLGHANIDPALTR